MGWSEADLLRWLARRARAHVLSGSVGHDAAVLRPCAGRPVLCADQVIEGVHAEVGESGRTLGRKAAGRALSDLAATAARPHALLLTIAAPREESARRLRAVIEGVDAKAREHGAALVGGDLAATRGPLTLSVAAFGSYLGPKAPPGRDRARPGQLVLASGPFGGSRAGRHRDPRPRFDAAAFLHDGGATALMDVSDGLALDLTRLATASRVRIDLEHVPVHADARREERRGRVSARRHALTDGEDHELLATLSPRRWSALGPTAARRFPGLVVIGRVRRGRGLWLAPEDGGALAPWDGVGGWVHGS